MIKIDLSTALFFYLLMTVIAVLLMWVFFNFGTKLKSFSSEEKYIWHCNICAHTYIDSKNAEISQCPKCKSYLEKV